MNKIPFGKIPQKAMHKWSVLGNYIRSLLWGSLETCLQSTYKTSYFSSSELEALNHFLFSNQAWKEFIIS